MNCPLCQGSEHVKYDEDKFRAYFLCRECSLIFVPRDKILPFKAEAERYEAHENDEDDPHYREYLSKTADAIRTVVGKNDHGLDFGCGKTRLMSMIFESHGIKVDSYDLYFHPKQEIWEKTYDFIILSEVVEHLSDPAGVMKKLAGLLKRKGHIFIKTKLYPPDPFSFNTWFYKRDQTHVQFFDYNSLVKLGELMKMKGPRATGAPDLFEFRK